nr:hypothetical protein [Clostridia bacterium]
MVFYISFGIILLAFGIFNYVASILSSKGRPISSYAMAAVLRCFAVAIMLAVTVCLWFATPRLIDLDWDYEGRGLLIVVSLFNSIILCSLPLPLVIRRFGSSFNYNRTKFMTAYIANILALLAIGFVETTLISLVTYSNALFYHRDFWVYAFYFIFAVCAGAAGFFSAFSGEDGIIDSFTRDNSSMWNYIMGFGVFLLAGFAGNYVIMFVVWVIRGIIGLFT